MALERLPYFQFHSADYLLDTRALTMPQHGAYCLLIMNYYWHGEIPSDKEKIYDMACADTVEKKADVDKVLAKFFHQDGGKFIHRRIEREMDKLGDMIRRNTEAGKASAAARAKNPKANGSQRPAWKDNAVQPEKPPIKCGNCSKPITGGWSQSPKGRVCDPCYKGYMSTGWPT